MQVHNNNMGVTTGIQPYYDKEIFTKELVSPKKYNAVVDLIAPASFRKRIIVQKHHVGYVVNKTDLNDMVEKISEILSDSNMWQTMHINALNAVEKRS